MPPRHPCTSKIRHPTRSAALATLHRLKRPDLNLYHCPQCKGWHLGKSNNSARRANRIDQLLRTHAEALRLRLLSKDPTP